MNAPRSFSEHPGVKCLNVRPPSTEVYSEAQFCACVVSECTLTRRKSAPLLSDVNVFGNQKWPSFRLNARESTNNGVSSTTFAAGCGGGGGGGSGGGKVMLVLYTCHESSVLL